MAGFDAVAYRMVNDGTAARRSSSRSAARSSATKSYELRWRITHYAGNRYLRHDVQVSRGGHHLAYALTATGTRRRRCRDTSAGRASTWGSTGLAPGVAGSARSSASSRAAAS